MMRGFRYRCGAKSAFKISCLPFLLPVRPLAQEPIALVKEQEMVGLLLHLVHR